MLSFKKSADTLPSFDIYHIGIEVNFPIEEKRVDKINFTYSPLVEYKIPVFRHPGGVLQLETCVETAYFQRLELKYGEVLSSFALKLKLRPYSAVPPCAPWCSRCWWSTWARAPRS